MKLLRTFYFVIVLFLGTMLCSCTPNGNQKSANEKLGSSAELTYAKGFRIERSTNYTHIFVLNPWNKGSVLANYYLVKNTNTEVPKDGIKITIPIKTIAAASVTHYEFLSLLDELNTLKGICQGSLVYNATVREGLQKNIITDLGDAFHINLEQVLQLRPSALMMSGYNQNDPNAQRIAQAGVPVIYNSEWMETTLLGRAEWIKFVGAFYDKDLLADSIFRTVENRYNEIKTLAKNIKKKPNIMSGANFRGTWYMPGGKSFMGQLFADAGGEYYYVNDTATGSLPLNVETVLMNFSTTDIWLNCNYTTIKDLLAADSKHSFFKPVKNKQVYNFNKRMLPSGANDFWESAIARPDLLLSDVIAILHPELMKNYELVYAEKLK